MMIWWLAFHDEVEIRDNLFICGFIIPEEKHPSNCKDFL